MKPLTKKLYAFAMLFALVGSAGFMCATEGVTAYNNASFQDLDNITQDISDLVINNMGAVLTILVVVAIIGLGVWLYKKIKKGL